MKKSTQIGLIVIIIALIGTGIGIGVFFAMNPPSPPSQDDDVVLTIKGSGITADFTLTMSELQSSEYQQFENLFYARSVDRNATYSGVSIRDILEKESLLTEDAINYTFIATDGWNSAVAAGYFLTIDDLMAADYDECIFAYGGTDFDPEEDGLIRSVINMTVYPELEVGKFWSKNCTEMKIIGEPYMTLWGSGTTDSLILTMSELQSSKYQQFVNQFYARSIDRNGTYSGVSIRDILEKESLLNGGAVNYTFIAADGWDSSDSAGYYLNITELMNADYDECIFAYGGTDFDPEDGPIRTIINMTVHPGIEVGKFWSKNCTEMKIIGEPYMTLWGSGTTDSLILTMSELQSSKYQQFVNQFYARSIDRNGTYSGVSIRDILEKESLLNGGAVNYTFIAADGWDSSDSAGYYLNITELMNADYDECIFAYGGTDFEPEDGPIRSIINMTVHPGVEVGKFWSKNCTEMQIIGEPYLTIWGSGTTGSLILRMSELQSSKYQQFENQFYARSIDRNGTYSGVSIRDILEKESLVLGSAINFTFISADGYDSAVGAGYYLDIDDLMAADYDECIFAYGGTDFDPLDDGPLRSIINMTVFLGIDIGKFWNKNCAEMQIIKPGIV